MRRISRKELKIALIVIGAVCVLSVCAMVAALIHFKPAPQPEFTPPAFDSAAVAGVLEETDELKGLLWSKVQPEGSTYAVYICGGVLINEQNQADLWFYNVPENESWLKLRIFDAKERVIAETGLIKPGEYLQTVQFTRAVADDEELAIKVMGYEPETYLSTGAFSLKPAVKNR
ncbi:MAG: hypothetical protein IJ995_05635 [Clostridia bacterium]|nr:hypothetical protein [Clostridia bacterium]